MFGTNSTITLFLMEIKVQFFFPPQGSHKIKLSSLLGILPQDNHRQVKMRAERVQGGMNVRTNPRNPGSKTNYSQYDLHMERRRVSQVSDCGRPFSYNSSNIFHHTWFSGPLPISHQEAKSMSHRLNLGRSLWPPWQVRVCQKLHCGTDFWAVMQRSHTLRCSQDAHS